MGIRFFIDAVILLSACSVTFAGPFGNRKAPRPPRGVQTKRRPATAPISGHGLPALESQGRVRRVGPNTLVVEADDTRILTLNLKGQTHLADSIREGARVHIEALTDSAGNLTATRIETMTGSAPVAPVTVSIAGGEPPERTREWVSTLSKQLPAYTCRQLTTRYVFESKESGWQAKDVVSAEVAYTGDREDYRNIRIGGQKTERTMPQISGTKSTGEYATALRNLFAADTGTRFLYHGDSVWNGAKAAVYDFAVSREHSDWTVLVGGQAIVPAFSGTVWIDAATFRVLRIEMQADGIPAEFPLDRVEAAVEYGSVGLGRDAYFLPLHAENLACHRGSSQCDRNVVEFRNYRKFASDSRLLVP